MRHADQVTGFMEFSKTKESISLMDSPHNSINSPERALFPKWEKQLCIPLLCLHHHHLLRSECFSPLHTVYTFVFACWSLQEVFLCVSISQVNEA